MEQTARSWLVYSLTHSALQLGLVNAVQGIPLLFFGIIAGVFADRYGRKFQLIISRVTNVILNIVLATLIVTGRIEVWHIYVTGFLAGTVQAFQQPAAQVLVSDLVGPKHLLNAVSLNNAANNMSRIVGPAICAAIIPAFGVGISYYFEAAMYAMAAIWITQIRIPETTAHISQPADVPRQSFIESLRQGFTYILAHKVILALMVLALAPMLLGGPYIALMPIFAVDIFHGNAGTQGLLLTVGGIGAITGALLVTSLGLRHGNIKLLIGMAAGYGLSLVLFSQSPVLWMAMIATFISSACMSQYQAQDQTIIQMITPGEIRGRVLGVYSLSGALYPLGSLMMGALASGLGAPWAVTIMGSACLLVAVSVAIFARGLRKLKLTSEPERSAT